MIGLWWLVVGCGSIMIYIQVDVIKLLIDVLIIYNLQHLSPQFLSVEMFKYFVVGAEYINDRWR
jgi:hypothetical protein